VAAAHHGVGRARLLQGAVEVALGEVAGLCFVERQAEQLAQRLHRRRRLGHQILVAGEVEPSPVGQRALEPFGQRRRLAAEPAKVV
tara:strand:+ start:1554 stop:1811 length:258 start_codon:yes stop_codon:yes gene_type:complete